MTTATASTVISSQDVFTERPRISSIDLMRGLVMVIMALDHVRDFFHADALVFDPTDLQKTSPILFFTRFITHYCAPTFVLLSGVSIRISEGRKSKKEMSIFLLTRGLWLILLEVTLVRFSFFFQWYYDVTFFQVIWAIGMSMVVLSALIHLPFKLIVGIGLVIVFGHDILHPVRLTPGSPLYVPWTLTHQVGGIEFMPGKLIRVAYPFLPWLGIMLLGYGIGTWYGKGFDPAVRKKFLLRTGLVAIALFVILRGLNLYGDPRPWTEQRDMMFSLLSFLNVTKYPPSLLYTLVTLGPVFILLSRMENTQGGWVKPLVIFGRVPLFYYILHFFVLHAAALILFMMKSGKSFSDIDFHMSASFGGLTTGAGYSLAGTYLAWAIIVCLIYPICKVYNQYKSTHTHWWLSYL